MTSRTIALCLLGVVAVISLSPRSLGAGKLVEHGYVTFDIAPDGHHVVFVSADCDLYLFHLETLRVSQLTKTPGKETTPGFSPDGKSIIYAADVEGKKGSGLFVCSLDGEQVRQLTNDSVTSDSMPSYSSDGSRIVFARAHRNRRYRLIGDWTWDDWDLYVMKSDGTQLRRVTQQKYYGVSSPKFLPDGSNIVYSAEGDRARSDLTSMIFVVDAIGKKPPKPLTGYYSSWTRGDASGSQPDVSPNGGSIAFISDRMKPYHYDVFIMNRDGSALTPLRVTQISRYNKHPVLFPDGKSLLFLAGREWNAESRPIFSLWKVDADGKNPRRMAESELFTNPRRWKPER